jgi:hypothetical protein
MMKKKDKRKKMLSKEEEEKERIKEKLKKQYLESAETEYDDNEKVSNSLLDTPSMINAQANNINEQTKFDDVDIDDLCEIGESKNLNLDDYEIITDTTAYEDYGIKPFEHFGNKKVAITEEIINKNRLIQTERSIERYVGQIFPSNKSERLNKEYSKQWPVKARHKISGKVITVGTQGIKIKPSLDKLRYTTETLKIYWALIFLWNANGCPEANVEIESNLSDLCKILTIEKNGEVYKRLIKELYCLKETSLEFLRSFEVKGGEKYKSRNINILTEFNHNYREKTQNKYEKALELDKEHQSKQKFSFKFNSDIIENLKNKVTIPVNLKVLNSIRSSIAQSMYTKTNKILMWRYKEALRGGIVDYENTARRIVGEIGLKQKNYKYPSRRKALINLIVKALDGKELTQPGYTIKAELFDAANMDYKVRFTLVVDKTKIKKSNRPKVINTDPDVIRTIIDRIKEYIQPKTNKDDDAYKIYAQVYSYDLINVAVGQAREKEEYLKTIGNEVTNRGGWFSNTLHQEVHKKRLKWIDGCDDNNESCPILKRLKNEGYIV